MWAAGGRRRHGRIATAVASTGLGLGPAAAAAGLRGHGAGGPCILSTGLKRPSAGGLSVLELVNAGGWPMIPLLLLSAVALAIIVERFWALRRQSVLPPGLGGEGPAWASRGNPDPAPIASPPGHSPTAHADW